MSLYSQQYIEKGYTVSFGLCVPNKKDTDDMIDRTQSSSKVLSELYNRKDTVIIDHNDLKEAHRKFKDVYKNMKIEEILRTYKKPLLFKMHQKLGIMKTLRLKKEKIEKILWGHIQRSGKSYIIAGSIIEDSISKESCNYLIITTAINETEEQYHNVFNHLQFEDFNVKTLKKGTKDEIKELLNKGSKKNIIIISDMYIKNTNSKNKEEYEEDEKMKIKFKWLRDLNFDFVFLDESHNGGTTEMAQKMMDYYGHVACNIHYSNIFKTNK